GPNRTCENSLFGVPMPGDVATSSCDPNCPRDGNAIAVSDGSGITVRYSSLLGGVRLDPDVSNVVIKGNIGDKGRNSCQPNARFSNNVWSGAKCSPSDRTAELSKVFVNATSTPFDLRLKAGSPALGAGDPADHPKLDVDGQLRPNKLAPDAGAWQREPALVVPGRSIGTARIGMTEPRIVAFYGSSRHRVVGRLPNGSKAAFDPYRVRGGKLQGTYRADRVVSVATTSVYYRTAKGLAVGSPLTPRGTDSTCRPVGAPTGKARLYVQPSRSKHPVVTELLVVAGHFTPLCAIPSKSR